MFHLLCIDENPSLPAASPQQAPGEEMALTYARTVDEALAQAAGCDVVLVSAQLPQDKALEIVRALAVANLPARVLVKDLASAQAAPAEFIAAGAAGWTL